MRALTIKMFRDLAALRGQAFAIALVIAAGVATYVMSANTLGALQETRRQYYQDYRFADVFASLKRAPPLSAPSRGPRESAPTRNP